MRKVRALLFSGVVMGCSPFDDHEAASVASNGAVTDGTEGTCIVGSYAGLDVNRSPTREARWGYWDGTKSPTKYEVPKTMPASIAEALDAVFPNTVYMARIAIDRETLFLLLGSACNSGTLPIPTSVSRPDLGHRRLHYLQPVPQYKPNRSLEGRPDLSFTLQAVTGRYPTACTDAAIAAISINRRLVQDKLANLARYIYLHSTVDYEGRRPLRDSGSAGNRPSTFDTIAMAAEHACRYEFADLGLSMSPGAGSERPAVELLGPSGTALFVKHTQDALRDESQAWTTAERVGGVELEQPKHSFDRYPFATPVDHVRPIKLDEPGLMHCRSARIRDTGEVASWSDAEKTTESGRQALQWISEWMLKKTANHDVSWSDAPNVDKTAARRAARTFMDENLSRLCHQNRADLQKAPAEMYNAVAFGKAAARSYDAARQGVLGALDADEEAIRDRMRNEIRREFAAAFRASPSFEIPSSRVNDIANEVADNNCGRRVFRAVQRGSAYFSNEVQRYQYSFTPFFQHQETYESLPNDDCVYIPVRTPRDDDSPDCALTPLGLLAVSSAGRTQQGVLSEPQAP